MTKYCYKDALPHNTIKRIKTILKKIDISTEESFYVNNLDSLFSLMLFINGFEYYVNGKATTRNYALASAYAEFMERLQKILTNF